MHLKLDWRFDIIFSQSMKTDTINYKIVFNNSTERS